MKIINKCQYFIDIGLIKAFSKKYYRVYNISYYYFQSFKSGDEENENNNINTVDIYIYADNIDI